MPAPGQAVAKRVVAELQPAAGSPRGYPPLLPPKNKSRTPLGWGCCGRRSGWGERGGASIGLRARPRVRACVLLCGCGLRLPVLRASVLRCPCVPLLTGACLRPPLRVPACAPLPLCNRVCVCVRVLVHPLLLLLSPSPPANSRVCVRGGEGRAGRAVQQRGAPTAGQSTPEPEQEPGPEQKLRRGGSPPRGAAGRARPHRGATGGATAGGWRRAAAAAEGGGDEAVSAAGVGAERA